MMGKQNKTVRNLVEKALKHEGKVFEVIRTHSRYEVFDEPKCVYACMVEADANKKLLKFWHFDTQTLEVDLNTLEILSFDGHSDGDRDSLNNVIDVLGIKNVQFRIANRSKKAQAEGKKKMLYMEDIEPEEEDLVTVEHPTAQEQPTEEPKTDKDGFLKVV
jgi:hypothetical protein